MAQIYLRESTFADCEYFAVWETQPAVTQFFTIDADRDYEEVVTEFVHRQDDTDKLQLTVCLRENDKPIGRIYISNIDDHYDSLDITRIYIADPAIRGRGLGEAALRAALKLAFEELHCERVKIQRKSVAYQSGIFRNACVFCVARDKKDARSDGICVTVNLKIISEKT